MGCEPRQDLIRAAPPRFSCLGMQMDRKSNVGHIQTWKESETPVIGTEGENEFSMGPMGVIEREKRQREKEGKRYKGKTGTRTDAEQKSKLKSVDQGTAECVALRKHLLLIFGIKAWCFNEELPWEAKPKLASFHFS